MKNVAIIGAGLVGRLLAWRLIESGLDIHITLIDQHPRTHIGTGLIAAAMVAPYTEAVNSESITQDLGACSYTLWSHWLPELEAKMAQTVGFNQQGTLVVSHPQDDADWQRFHIKARAIVGAEHMQELDVFGLETIEPELTQNFSKALYFAREGVVNNLQLYPVLADYFDQSDKVNWIENRICDDFDNKGHIKGFKQSFEYIFDCRGQGAKADLKQFRLVRGEVIRVYAPEVQLSHAVRLMHPRFPLYIAPRPDHEYIIGATQIESDADVPVTVRSGLELLSALYSLHPGFSEAQVIQMLSGLRPTFMNNLPRVEIDNQLIRINGLYRHGYLFTPALLADLLHYLEGNETAIRFPQFIQPLQSYDSNQYQQQQANT